MTEKLELLSEEEVALRWEKVIRNMGKAKSLLITDNANLFYLTGRVFAGYIYYDKELSHPIYFVRRPVHLEGDNLVYIRKPEDIAEHVAFQGEGLALELDTIPYSTVERLMKVFECPKPLNASAILRNARATKTAEELAMIQLSGEKHASVYRSVPALYEEGMTDMEFQIAIEALSRRKGCLGQFRIAGGSMEIFMGNLLAGNNADAPSPYDFAMGGAGADPSLPVGANGTTIKPGEAVMVDMCGNFTGYMTDMTRSYYLDHVSDLARKAHQCSIDICHTLQKIGCPGVEAKLLYETAIAMVQERGLESYFMGHRQHAGFIGHGVGIEINEIPVIAPRSKDILALGNVIALEPKFVIPEVGAVGIENTYVVEEGGMRCLTNGDEELRPLE